MGTSITRSLVPLVARIEKLLVSHIPMPSRLARCSSATLIPLLSQTDKLRYLPDAYNIRWFFPYQSLP